MNTSPRDRKAFPSCFQVYEHPYVFSFSEIYLCIRAKNLIFPARGFLYYFPIYCIITTLLHLSSGFHCSDFFEKTSLHKGFHAHSVLSRTVRAVVSWGSLLTAHTSNFRRMNHACIFHVHCPKVVNRSASLKWCQCLLLTVLSAEVASFECKTRRKETLRRLIQTQLPKYSPGKIARFGQIFSNY